MNQLKCAIAGLGRIASSLEDDPLREKPASHAGAINHNPNCFLVAGADPNPEQQNIFSKRWDCSSVYSNTSEMLCKNQVDILHIASPPETHLDIVLEALNHPPKLIICEKPLADHLKKAQKLVQICHDNDIILMTNYERRYSKDYMYLKRIIQDKKYGELLSIRGQLFMGKNRKPSEMLWDDGTHMLDILRFLTGNELSLEKVFGNPYAPGGFIHIIGAFNHSTFFMELGGKRDYLVFEMDFSFENGFVRIGNGVFDEFESKKSPYYENFNSLIPVPSPNFKKTNYFSGMLSDAVSILQKKKIQPTASGQDGLISIRMMNEIINNF